MWQQRIKQFPGAQDLVMSLYEIGGLICRARSTRLPVSQSGASAVGYGEEQNFHRLSEPSILGDMKRVVDNAAAAVNSERDAYLILNDSILTDH